MHQSGVGHLSELQRQGCQLWQSAEVLQPGVCYLGIPEAKCFQLGKSFQMHQSRARDFVPVEVEPLQLRKRLQVLKPRVGDLRAIESQHLQRRHLRKPRDSLVSDTTPPQIEPL